MTAEYDDVPEDEEPPPYAYDEYAGEDPEEEDYLNEGEAQEPAQPDQQDEKVIVKNITSAIIAKAIAKKAAVQGVEGEMFIPGIPADGGRRVVLEGSVTYAPPPSGWAQTTAAQPQGFHRVFKAHYPTDSESMLEVEVTHNTTSYPSCSSYVPSEEDLKDSRQLPDNWPFNTGFRHPRCQNKDQIAVNGTAACSYKNRWTECNFYSPALPTLLKECKLNDEEAVYLGEVFNQENVLVSALVKKTGKEYTILKMGETTNINGDVMKMWQEVTDSYGAPITDIKSAENFSYLASIIA